MHELPPAEEMMRAFFDRDASYDGVFFTCVRTTGIFCRPVCTARKPKRDNVEFVATASDALHAGYRACKICRPLAHDAGRPAWVETLMTRLDSEPAQRISDAALRDMDIEPARARRYYKRHFGVTFHAYQRALRLGTAMRALNDNGSIAAAAHDAGFESESGFRDAFARVFGAPPGQRRDASCLRARWIATPLGPMIAVASDRGLALLEFVDRPALERELRDLRRRFEAAIVPGRNEHLEQTERELAEYFGGTRRRFDIALDPAPTPFQRLVWNRLRGIGYGETVSYRTVAGDVGKPGAARAVGRANGMNPIAIVVPCHRVVRADGSLSGYGGGVWRKRRLLDLESSASS
ncbi:MAG: methylated-DNA--[protein]-cysteine S-methyltransferase [Planctomycetota bacterium]|nr:methylated-DNA--[protein]-cysteine S-methyltransferase [Planctomycetota bacterium]